MQSVEIGKIELDSSVLTLDESGVVCQDYKLQSNLSIKDAQEISEQVNYLASLTSDPKKKLLSSMDGLLDMDKEVREYFVNYPTKYDWKIALVYANSMAKVITTLIFMIAKPRFETKCFTNYQEALNWLNQK